jgi:ribosomal protein S18 acetylase RimI-like enzyme
MFQASSLSPHHLSWPASGLQKPFTKMGRLPVTETQQDTTEFKTDVANRPSSPSLSYHTIIATSKLETQDLQDFVRLSCEAFPPRDAFGKSLKAPTEKEKQADAAQLLALHESLTTYSKQTLLALKGASGELEGGVVLCSFYPLASKRKPIAEICNLVLAPQYRRLGLGTALVKEVEKKAKEFGYSSALVTVDKTKPALKNFYKKLGYKKMPFFKALWTYQPWYTSRFLSLPCLWNHPFYEKTLR